MAGKKNISIQLVTGKSLFMVPEMVSFSEEMKLGECDLPCAVVSIIGTQGSGKSTLLNHLFGTNFKELDASVRRGQTTQGIWLAKAANIESLTLVLDVEGTDGNAKGVHVTALPNYIYRRPEFKKEVVSLRDFIVGLAGNQEGKVPASEILLSAPNIWQQIMENKELDLYSHKIMAATLRCDKILNDRFTEIKESKDWRNMEKAVNDGPVLDFGKKLTLTISTCLTKYVEQTLYLDGGVRDAKRQLLLNMLLQLVQPLHKVMLKHLHAKALSGFSKALQEALAVNKKIEIAAPPCRAQALSMFREDCNDATVAQVNLDSSDVLDRLENDIDANIATVTAQLDVAKEKARYALSTGAGVVGASASVACVVVGVAVLLL